MKSSTFKGLALTMCLSILGIWGTVWGQPIVGIDALRAKAKSERTVRGIARLKELREGLSINALRRAQASLIDIMKKAGVTYAKAIEGLPFVVLSVDNQQLTTLEENNQISEVFEDKINKPYLGESVPLIEVLPAWDTGGRGQGQTVAILDTGVESSHPFLHNKVVAEACFSSNFAEHGATTVCPNGQEEHIGSGAGAACTVDGCLHGTHVAGIAAGKGNTFSGVAPDANIIAIQVFSKFTDQPGGPQVCREVGTTSPCVLTYTSDQIRALQHVKSLAGQHSISAVNMGFGGGHHTTHCNADARKESIDQLRKLKIATVIASGNEAFTDGVGEPACISSAVTVGATTKSDLVANFSNSSSSLVDLLAPGVSIHSSILNGLFGNKSGTSMAAPMVAGAWAVLKSLNAGHDVDQIKKALVDTGKPILDSRNGVTKPRINIRDAANLPDAEVDLALTMSGTPSQVLPGEALMYSLMVKNLGTVEATDVVLTSTFPAGVEFRSASFPGCQHQSGTTICSWTLFPAQTQQTITVMVDVKESTIGILTNTTQVISTEIDQDLTNNIASIETAVVLAGKAPDPTKPRIINVFFGTDRKPTGYASLSEHYGSEQGDFQYGIAKVSIPPKHKLGEMESPVWWKLEFSPDPQEHIMLTEVTSLVSRSFYKKLRREMSNLKNDDIFVFIHGFNVSWNDSIRRTAQLVHDLQYPGIPISYSWPSQDSPSLAGYMTDLNYAEWSYPHLKKFLLDIKSRTGARKIHVLAHSMGNQVLTKAIRDLEDDSLKLNQVILAAPDIDSKIFRKDIAPYLQGKANRFTLYASSKDAALEISKTLQGGTRIGQSGQSLTLIDGIDTIDASSIDTSILGHSYYGDERELLMDIFHVTTNGLPPTRRNLDKDEIGGKPYWILRQ